MPIHRLQFVEAAEILLQEFAIPYQQRIFCCQVFVRIVQYSPLYDDIHTPNITKVFKMKTKRVFSFTLPGKNA